MDDLTAFVPIRVHLPRESYDRDPGLAEEIAYAMASEVASQQGSFIQDRDPSLDELSETRATIGYRTTTERDNAELFIV